MFLSLNFTTYENEEFDFIFFCFNKLLKQFLNQLDFGKKKKIILQKVLRTLFILN